MRETDLSHLLQRADAEVQAADAKAEVERQKKASSLKPAQPSPAPPPTTPPTSSRRSYFVRVSLAL